jgi:hypothetical protein
MKKITKSIMLLLMLACLSKTSYSANGKEKQSVKYSQGKGEGEGQIESLSRGGRYRGHSVSNNSWRIRCRGFSGTCFTITAQVGYTEVLLGNGDYLVLEPSPVSDPSQGTELDPVEGVLVDTYTIEVPIANIKKWNPATQTWDSVIQCNIWIVEP